jgi:hypothetical protein
MSRPLAAARSPPGADHVDDLIAGRIDDADLVSADDEIAVAALLWHQRDDGRRQLAKMQVARHARPDVEGKVNGPRAIDVALLEDLPAGGAGEAPSPRPRLLAEACCRGCIVPFWR